MLALDTNVLVRFITRDDEIQADEVDRFLENAAQQGEILFISDTEFCELAWILQSGYHLNRRKVADVMRGLIYSYEIEIMATSNVEDALVAFEQGVGDFADYLTREQSLAAGCRAVVTFDRDLLKSEGFIKP